MEVFSEVYTRCIITASSDPFESSWAGVQAKLRDLLVRGGPNAGQSAVLDEIRRRLREVGKGQAKPAAAAAAEILKASRAGTPNFDFRAALLKSMRHFYFVIKKGNQKIWVFDGPKRYNVWTFDLFRGKSGVELEALLREEEEVFGGGGRQMMSDGLQLARKWATDVQAKLASPSAQTLTAVQRWFHTPATAASDVKATATKLHEGFKRIAATCNSTSVIFSDRPAHRASSQSGWVIAAVTDGDDMPVIYVFKLFFDSGARDPLRQMGRLWKSAMVIIHELSHKLARTWDFKYGHHGLKPDVFFTPAQAADNADSWAFFTADIVGALPAGARKRTFW